MANKTKKNTVRQAKLTLKELPLHCTEAATGPVKLLLHNNGCRAES